MNTTIYNQLLTDTQDYIKTQYKLLQVRSIEQTSRLIGMIIMMVMLAAIVVIGLIFLAIATAAWLEQWLPMWASYLVIAGAMLLIALVVYLGRKWWFVHPIEKHLSEVVMEDTTPIKMQKQSLENQSSMQRDLLQRDMDIIQQDWTQLRFIWDMIKRVVS